jgi:hypothetical protein
MYECQAVGRIEYASHAGVLTEGWPKRPKEKCKSSGFPLVFFGVSHKAIVEFSVMMSIS